MYAKRYFGVFVGVILLVLCVAATISYIGDPGGVFHSSNYENEMVDILLSGHNVIKNPIENINWGEFRSTFIARDPIRRDTIVLGSSRALMISNDMLNVLPVPKNRSFMNNWVAGAMLEDEIAIFECYAEKGEMPRTIILSLDPSSFYEEGLTFQSLDKYYSKGLKQIGISPSAKNEIPILDKRYYDLIAYPTVNAAKDKILTGIENKHPTPTDEEYGDYFIDLQDGRGSYPRAFLEKAAEGGVYDTISRTECQKIWHLNTKKVKLFEKFIDYLLENDVRVIIYLAPHSPGFVTDPNYCWDQPSEEYIRKYAAEKNITVVGSFDPAPYNLTSADFLDPIHPRLDTIVRIFAAGDIGRRR